MSLQHIAKFSHKLVALEIYVLLASPLVRAFSHRSRLSLSVASTFRLRHRGKGRKRDRIIDGISGRMGARRSVTITIAFG